jgi:hypothetical protein
VLVPIRVDRVEDYEGFGQLHTRRGADRVQGTRESCGLNRPRCASITEAQVAAAPRT